MYADVHIFMPIWSEMFGFYKKNKQVPLPHQKRHSEHMVARQPQCISFHTCSFPSKVRHHTNNFLTT